MRKHTSPHVPLERPRTAGALLHPTSLPGRYGIGDLGDETIAFLDWMASAGMTIWQILPVNPPGFGHSPYGCVSSFAGNPLLISPQRMLEDGLLEAGETAEPPAFSHDRVEFDRVIAYKDALLRNSWNRFAKNPHPSFVPFVEEHRAWLDEYALFMTLKGAAGGRAWWEWEPGVRLRHDAAMAEARAEHAHEIGYWQYTQWLFCRQWDVVRAAARERGINILGDVPIYVAADSADVWGHRDLFWLDDDGLPTVVAGVPPDYFSATGQRWGNPLYRWDEHRATGYRWWIGRVKANLRFADMIRLDHFRGFAAYWEIQASEPTAVNGRWMPGPGRELFDAIRGSLGDLPLVAEDLGFITAAVHQLRAEIGLPGMKIVQFGFGEDDSPHLPHRFEPRTVAYTGTHDNDTACGWFASADEDERQRAMTYLGEGDIAWGMIRAVYTSVAEMAIVPVQDILSLGSDARMNTPGEERGNWSWRLPRAALTRQHSERLRQLGVIAGR